jgi:hypothetical protein
MNRATQIRQKRTLVLLAVSHRALAKASQEALTHYWVGLKTAGVGLPVAWDYVAQCMAEALEGPLGDALEQEAERARQA